MCTAIASTYTPYITAFIGLLVGGFISYRIGVTLTERNHSNALTLIEMNHSNARLLAQNHEFNKAAADFRAAFVDYIYQIKHTESMTNADIGWHKMREIHTSIAEGEHGKAKIRFEPFISRNDLPCFHAAWEDYRNWLNHFDDQDDTTDKKDAILHNIDVLLEYAKLK